MRITSFQLWNYKSFHETPKVELTRGMNIITGQNNAGKTALLQFLSLSRSTVAHRSPKTLPSRESLPEPESRIDISVVFSKDEILKTLADQAVLVPLPPTGLAMPDFTIENYETPSLDSFREWFFSRPEHTFHLRFGGGHWSMRRPSWLGASSEFQGVHSIKCNISRIGTTSLVNSSPHPNFNMQEEIGTRLGMSLPENVFLFDAQRFNLGESGFGEGKILNPQAANLAGVLGVLQGEGLAFDDFNREVTKVLPQVGRITVAPSNMQRILVWTDAAYNNRREDLAFSLSDSGTGVGQVAAILYVVMTSASPRIILIDEPQSFLHPGAARKLIEVLKRYPQHQYIVATHSPTVISASEAKTIIMVKNDGIESTLEHLDAEDTDHLRNYLNEIGASLADVFGFDNIAWVEGPTEEKCFPLIVATLLKRPLMGTVFKGVAATGDFEGKRAERFFDIYSRVSSGPSLLPPALGFIFDSDAKSAQQKAELRSLGEKRVQFLKRRMYENYLLDPDAIAHVLNTTYGHSKVVTKVEVSALLDTCFEDARLFEPPAPGNSYENIRADKVLKRLFWNLGGLDFRKTTHSIELTEWLLSNKRDSLKEVADTIQETLWPTVAHGADTREN